MVNAQQQRLVRAIEAECVHVEAPLQRIESKLHPFSVFLILPLFAFANAGVHVDFSQFGNLVLEPITLGVILGLLVGKQAGIMIFAGLAVALKLAELPKGVQWKHIYAVSWLAGIGFTMSLFITPLAFAVAKGTYDPTSGPNIMQAKVGILLASVIAGIIGTGILYWTTRKSASPN
jgi:NhaA family Na+:H+ antiporter